MKMLCFVILTLTLSCSTKNRQKAHGSAKVFSALKASGLSPMKSGQTEIYRAENVNCLKDLTASIWKCGFMNNGRSYFIPQAESAVLSGILFDLPVPRGDSGAATPFIECRMYDVDPENARCDIAISLDNQVP